MRREFTSPGPLNTAVLFLVFNRPEATAQVFEAIRQAKPPRLYVAADGPREGHEGEVERVARVREIAMAIDWPCEVKTLFREKNVGCQFGPRGGIDWFFSNEEQGIILEDDCLPSQSFFWFCEEILNHYSENDRIMAVTGTNITKGLYFEGDYFVSRYALMWGWASWRRAWVKYDPDLIDWPVLKKRKWLRSLGIGGRSFRSTWTSIFDRTFKLGKQATWWDYQWIYTCWRNNGLTIAPSKNLVRNIGFSDEATHTLGYDRFRSNLVLNNIRLPLVHPDNLQVNWRADKFISTHWFHASWASLLKAFILRFPGAKGVNEHRKKLLRRLDRRS